MSQQRRNLPPDSLDKQKLQKTKRQRCQPTQSDTQSDPTLRPPQPLLPAKTSKSTALNMLANRNKPKTIVGKSQSTIDAPSWLPPSPLNPDLFTDDSRKELHHSYQTGLPYRHVQIPKLCTTDAMCRIQQEIIEYLPTTARETDLFKVNQSIDLNNIDLSSEFARKIPTLLSLRTYLYSPEFRELLEHVTGCAKIIDNVDCAANVYSGEHANHLLTHDDVITTRVLSYIIYLPLIDDGEYYTATASDINTAEHEETLAPVHFNLKNDKTWAPQFGGHLELFDKLSANILPFGVYPSAQEHIREHHHQQVLSDLVQQGVDVLPEHQNATHDYYNDTNITLPPRIINISANIPSKRVQPNFNTMVVFEVKPEQSYHAVQEVYSVNSKRISIQGWFHQEIRQPDYGATLRMLQIPTLLPPSSSTITSTTDSTSLESSHPETSEQTTTNNILQTVLDNKLSSLSEADKALLTRSMFPSRHFELFSSISEEFVTQYLAQASQQSTKNDSLESVLGESDINALIRIVLLHLRNVLLKQRAALALKSAETQPYIDQTQVNKTTTEHVEESILEDKPNSAQDNDDNNNVSDIEDDEGLIKAELAWLRKFISPQYTNVTILRQLAEQWDEQGVVQLSHFLRPDLIDIISKTLIRADIDNALALCPDFSSIELVSDEEQDEDEEAAEEASSELDFGLDEDDENAAVDEKEESEESDFDFGLDEDDDDDQDATTTHNTEDSVTSVDTCLITHYKKKQLPPNYIAGISVLNQSNDTSNNIGLWKLSGPSYLQRYAYYESILQHEFQDIVKTTAAAASTAASPSHIDSITDLNNFSSLLNVFRALPTEIKAGVILESLVRWLMGTHAFSTLIEWVTQLQLLCHRTHIRRFRPGLDYSVGNYNDMLEASSTNALFQDVKMAQIPANDDAPVSIVPIDQINKDSLALLDISLTFCDEGQYDHPLAANIWSVEETTDLDNNHENNDLTHSAQFVNALYPGATKDVVIDDVDDLLDPDYLLYDESYSSFVAQQRIIQGMSHKNTVTNNADDEDVDNEVNVLGFTTLPPCSVRFLQKMQRWQSDDCGAFSAYVPMDTTTEGDDAQAYVEDGADDVISLSLSHNTLTICPHKPHVLHFVRYTNAHAPGSRWEIASNAIYQRPQTKKQDE